MLGLAAVSGPVREGKIEIRKITSPAAVSREPKFRFETFCHAREVDLEAQMPWTPSQRALDQVQSAAFMRNFYASLGMRQSTLERAIQHGKGLPVASAEPAGRRRRGRPRRK
jgi:hypothetical protein